MAVAMDIHAVLRRQRERTMVHFEVGHCRCRWATKGLAIRRTEEWFKSCDSCVMSTGRVCLKMLVDVYALFWMMWKLEVAAWMSGVETSTQAVDGGGKLLGPCNPTAPRLEGRIAGPWSVSAAQIGSAQLQRSISGRPNCGVSRSTTLQPFQVSVCRNSRLPGCMLQIYIVFVLLTSVPVTPSFRGFGLGNELYQVTACQGSLEKASQVVQRVAVAWGLGRGTCSYRSTPESAAAIRGTRWRTKARRIPKPSAFQSPAKTPIQHSETRLAIPVSATFAALRPPHLANASPRRPRISEQNGILFTAHPRHLAHDSASIRHRDKSSRYPPT
jgi:hypothetical protein